MPTKPKIDPKLFNVDPKVKEAMQKLLEKMETKRAVDTVRGQTPEDMYRLIQTMMDQDREEEK